MKDLYYFTIDDEPIIMSVDEEKNCRYIDTAEILLFYNQDIDEDTKKQKAKEFLETSVEDDSTWKTDVTYEDAMHEFEESDLLKIYAHIKADI